MGVYSSSETLQTGNIKQLSLLQHYNESDHSGWSTLSTSVIFNNCAWHMDALWMVLRCAVEVWGRTLISKVNEAYEPPRQCMSII